MKTAERVFENFADDVIQSWERGGKADLPILISQALLALREVVVPTEDEIEKVIREYRYQIDDDAKGIYIGENSGRWEEKQDKELGKAIQTELLHRLNEDKTIQAREG